MRAITAFAIGVILVLCAWWLSKIPVPEMDHEFIKNWFLNVLEYGDDALLQMIRDMQDAPGSLRNHLYNLFGYWP